MLSQRGEEFRSQRMLQNYNENYTDLNYHQQVHMPPTAEYSSMVNPIDQSWYNNYNMHGGGVQNGGVDYYGRENENKSSSDWSNYHSDPDSPFIPPQQINNNSEGQYSNMQPGSQIMGQQMQMEGSLMLNNQNQMIVPSGPDTLIMNQVHNGLIPNGVENSQVEQVQPSLQPKEEDNLPKIDSSSETMLVSSENQLKEGNKDGMRLPGFHQTFGNITEIGRFSQHDDYFESRQNEVVEEPKVSEPVEPPPPKRKPRGRKRKQPEPRDVFPRPSYGNGGGPGDSPIGPPCMQQEVCGGAGGSSGGGGPWPYPPPPTPNHHHPSYHESYHGQWRTHPYYHQQHYHHHHYAPPPPPPPPPHNMYYQHYNDCLPYHHYNSYPNNWHMNRDYMVHNYPSYV